MSVTSSWPVCSMLTKVLVNRQTLATSRVEMFTVCCPQYFDSFFPVLDPLASSTYPGKNTVDVYIINV